MEHHTLPLPSDAPSDYTHSSVVYVKWKRLQALIDRKCMDFDGQNLDTPMVIAVAKYIYPIALPYRFYPYV